MIFLTSFKYKVDIEKRCKEDKRVSHGDGQVKTAFRKRNNPYQGHRVACSKSVEGRIRRTWCGRMSKTKGDGIWGKRGQEGLDHAGLCMIFQQRHGEDEEVVT